MLRRNLTFVTVLGLTLTVAGCSSTDSPTVASPSASSTTKATESPAPATAETFGDAMMLAPVTDELGTYQHVTINPNADVMKLSRNVHETSVKENGFDDDTVLAAQQFIMKFIAEEALDSPAVDGTMDTWNAWASNVAPRYLFDGYEQALLGTENLSNTDRSLIILNNANNATPTLIRDGKPRLNNLSVSLTRVDGATFEDSPYLSFYGEIKADYRVSDAESIKRALVENPEATEADIVGQIPAFADGKENIFNYTFNYRYSVIPVDNTWVIGGYQTDNLTYGYPKEYLNQ